MESNESYATKPVEVISGVRILSPGYEPTLRYDVHVKNAKIKDICLHDDSLDISGNSQVLDATRSLLAPSLCHAHVHLDKCFLLSDPKYSDLEIVNGDFAEAMELTSRAKCRFSSTDLLRRGKWLIAESIAAGVTHMRAFVEVDHMVEYKCLDAALGLKKLFAGACEVQICAFAQEPLFSGDHATENRSLIERAVLREGVDVVGSTPYVEKNDDEMRKNIRWIISTALSRRMHLDLHLDYDLDPSKPPLTYYVAECLKNVGWSRSSTSSSHRTVALGHCTRLIGFPKDEWQRLAQDLESLPVSFVGLPTSDLFIQGKPSADSGGGERLRGTLQIPQMIQRYGISGCISINNVGNAFTPYGSCDPLNVASMGVGLYHAGTKDDAQILYECVSLRAKEVIGFPSNPIAVGEEADFVLFDVNSHEAQLTRRRGRRTLQEVVYDPPRERKTVFKGQIITV